MKPLQPRRPGFHDDFLPPIWKLFDLHGEVGQHPRPVVSPQVPNQYAQGVGMVACRLLQVGAQSRDGDGAVRRDLGRRTVAVSVQTLGVDIGGNGERKRKRAVQRQSRAPARS